MSPHKRKNYFNRDDDDTDSSYEDSDSNGWAVSYSDLLMVLMSFFVLYFSFDEGNKMNQIFWNLAQDRTPSAIQGSDSGQIIKGNLLKSFDKTIVETFRGSYEIEGQYESLIVHLPDSMYYPGSVEVKNHKELLVNDLIDRLMSIADKVDLTIIGHSDSTPLSKIKNYYLQDNFSLSALRASRVISNLIIKGFPREQLSISAGAENLRDTRSLSFKISMKRKKSYD